MNEQREYVSQEQVDSVVNQISEIFNQAAKTTFKSSQKCNKKDEKDKIWFGKACNNERSEYHVAKKKYKIPFSNK